MTVREDENGRSIQECARDAVGNGSCAWTQRRQARPGTLEDFGLGDRRESTASLGRRQHEAEIGPSGGIDQIQVSTAARHAEECADADLLQASDDQVAKRRHETAMLPLILRSRDAD